MICLSFAPHDNQNIPCGAQLIFMSNFPLQIMQKFSWVAQFLHGQCPRRLRQTSCMTQSWPDRMQVYSQGDFSIKRSLLQFSKKFCFLQSNAIDPTVNLHLPFPKCVWLKVLPGGNEWQKFNKGVSSLNYSWILTLSICPPFHLQPSYILKVSWVSRIRKIFWNFRKKIDWKRENYQVCAYP